MVYKFIIWNRFFQRFLYRIKFSSMYPHFVLIINKSFHSNTVQTLFNKQFMELRNTWNLYTYKTWFEINTILAKGSFFSLIDKKSEEKHRIRVTREDLRLPRFSHAMVHRHLPPYRAVNGRFSFCFTSKNDHSEEWVCTDRPRDSVIFVSNAFHFRSGWKENERC